MTNPKKSAVRPGEIRLELISKEWPLTPLGASKDPYIRSWQNTPYSIHEIENEILCAISLSTLKLYSCHDYHQTRNLSVFILKNNKTFSSF